MLGSLESYDSTSPDAQPRAPEGHHSGINLDWNILLSTAKACTSANRQAEARLSGPLDPPLMWLRPGPKSKSNPIHDSSLRLEIYDKCICHEWRYTLYLSTETLKIIAHDLLYYLPWRSCKKSQVKVNFICVYHIVAEKDKNSTFTPLGPKYESGACRILPIFGVDETMLNTTFVQFTVTCKNI